MSELTVGTISGLAANSYEVGIASGSTLDLANAKAGSIPDTALASFPGLVHITTTSFTDASAVSLDNVFSSSYKNYRIVANIDSGDSADADRLLYFRLRSNGSDDTTNNYRSALLMVNIGGTALENVGGYAQTFAPLAKIYYSGTKPNTVLDIFNPYLGLRGCTYTFQSFGSSASIQRHNWGSGQKSGDTSYDGITFVLDQSTISGEISVYGYGEY